MQVVEPFQLVKFKSSVLAQQCERIGNQILNYQKYIDPIGRVMTNRGGWQSRFHEICFPFYDEWLKYLKQVLHEFYLEYVATFYEKRYVELYRDREFEQKYNLYMWFNINWPGDYNLEHSHVTTPNANEYNYIPPEMKDDREFWLPEAFGNFYITDTDNTFFVTEVPFRITEEEERTYIDLNAGDFILGNININHGVSINKQEIPRISMAYNIKPMLPEQQWGHT